MNDEPVGTHATGASGPKFLEAARAIERAAFKNEQVREQSLAMYSATFATTTSDSCRRFSIPQEAVKGMFEKYLGSYGIRDAFNICGPTVTGEVTLVGVGLPEQRAYSPSTYRTWNRVAAHLSAATQLRRSLANGGLASLEGAPAVVDPTSGKVVHASEAAQGSLSEIRSAAIDVDRARTKVIAENAARALALWRALFDGKWTVFDVFDTDGRRFVVAHENAPDVAADSRLTRRERQVAELVARGNSDALVSYMLGLSISTVRTHLARALRKLRLRSARELTEVATQLLGLATPKAERSRPGSNESTPRSERGGTG
ncbi:MAG: helix-turn-helix transcriptional regulator [Polyangiaceae bacterium]